MEQARLVAQSVGDKVKSILATAGASEAENADDILQSEIIPFYFSYTTAATPETWLNAELKDGIERMMMTNATHAANCGVRRYASMYGICTEALHVRIL